MSNIEDIEDPREYAIRKREAEYGVTRPILFLLDNMDSIRKNVSLYKDIVDPNKRHAYRLLLNTIDVLNGNAASYQEEAVVKANRDLCVLHLLNNPEIKPEQRKSIEKQAFYE